VFTPETYGISLILVAASDAVAPNANRPAVKATPVKVLDILILKSPSKG
jgi:hypothetical protein